MQKNRFGLIIKGVGRGVGTSPTTEKVMRQIAAVIRRHVDFERFWVFLFGSRALGHHHPASDFDVGIYGEEKVPLGAIALINDELENYPIPVDVEIVDFYSVTPDFKRVALKEIKIWNTPRINLKLI